MYPSEGNEAMHRHYKRCRLLLRNKKMGWHRLRQTGVTTMIYKNTTASKDIMKCSLTSEDGGAQMHSVPSFGAERTFFDVFFSIDPIRLVRVRASGLHDGFDNRLRGNDLRDAEKELDELLTLNGV